MTEKVFAGVREAFMEALGLEEDEILITSRVFEDLGAESLDLLEVVYLLEHQFGIKIPRDGIRDASKEQLDAEEYEIDGVLTPLAQERLQALMPEVPKEEFFDGMTPNDIPRLFRVGTFVNIVERLLADDDDADPNLPL